MLYFFLIEAHHNQKINKLKKETSQQVIIIVLPLPSLRCCFFDDIDSSGNDVCVWWCDPSDLSVMKSQTWGTDSFTQPIQGKPWKSQTLNNDGNCLLFTQCEMMNLAPCLPHVSQCSPFRVSLFANFGFCTRICYKTWKKHISFFLMRKTTNCEEFKSN